MRNGGGRLRLDITNRSVFYDVEIPVRGGLRLTGRLYAVFISRRLRRIVNESAHTSAVSIIGVKQPEFLKLFERAEPGPCCAEGRLILMDCPERVDCRRLTSQLEVVEQPWRGDRGQYTDDRNHDQQFD